MLQKISLSAFTLVFLILLCVGSAVALTEVYGTIYADSTWSIAGSPFIVTGDVTIANDATLTIDPGVVIRLNSSRSMQVNGVLEVLGELGSPVVFTSYRDDLYGGSGGAVQGDWGRLWLYEPDSACLFRHCIIRYAGWNYGTAISARGSGVSVVLDSCEVVATKNAGKGAVHSEYGATLDITGGVIRNNNTTGIYANGNLDLEGCTLTENTGHGVWCSGTSSVLSGNVSSGNGGYGYLVHAHTIDEVINYNTNTGNGYSNSVGVYGGSIWGVATWDSRASYEVVSDFTVANDATLTIDPGVVIRLNSSRSMQVNGVLEVLGELGSPVVFTSYRDDLYGGSGGAVQGDWGRLWLYEPDSACLFRHCIIRYAGWNYGTAISARGSGVSVVLDSCECASSNQMRQLVPKTNRH
ncbi:right-handed parallel beta-helix repeat-containing protein, partial [Candidatus Eisenbacteria bacterium]